jgi:hypothetical protein
LGTTFFTFFLRKTSFAFAKINNTALIRENVKFY